MECLFMHFILGVAPCFCEQACMWGIEGRKCEAKCSTARHYLSVGSQCSSYESNHHDRSIGRMLSIFCVHVCCTDSPCKCIALLAGHKQFAAQSHVSFEQHYGT
mmetsp:Transcript_37936/g.62724  ORF Transcript_37936/g.62724 Transcript_37936/m.62724 type:complete len:104 (-) Transcript_37936:90-401(-)